MSSSELQSSGEASTGTSPAELLIPEQERSLSQRMMLHVYNTSGIVSARQLAFWLDFSSRNPDVELAPSELRSMFFGEVLHEPEHFDDLAYEVVQYLNPRFNQFNPDALEFGDLMEGEDFLLNVPHGVTENGLDFDELVNYVSTPLVAARNVPLVPLNLQLVHAPPPQEVRLSEEDDLAKQFARLLSELVWTEEEKIEKPELDAPELRERVLALTEAGISLSDLLEPGMISYELLTQGPAPVPQTPTTNREQQDQVVPVAAATGKQSAAKRWKSFDDSGLGLSPRKRSRLMTPSTVAARRQHARLRRICSAPNDT